MCGKSNWFKKTNKEKQGMKTRRNRGRNSQGITQTPLEGVMFVPYTEDGKLRKMLQEQEKVLTGVGRIRYVEQRGATVGELLGTGDPWAGHCAREKCFPCNTVQTGKCMIQGGIYKITCHKCLEAGVKMQYIGESARTGYDRGEEHWDDLRREDDSNPLVEHHGNEDNAISMRIISVRRTPLARQTEEGILIEGFKGDIIMTLKIKALEVLLLV